MHNKLRFNLLYGGAKITSEWMDCGFSKAMNYVRQGQDLKPY